MANGTTAMSITKAQLQAVEQCAVRYKDKEIHFKHKLGTVEDVAA